MNLPTEEHYENLPNELLYHILSFVKDSKDLANSMLVNRTWYHLIEGSKELLSNFTDESIRVILKGKSIETPKWVFEQTNLAGRIEVLELLKKYSLKISLYNKAAVVIEKQFDSSTLQECLKPIRLFFRNLFSSANGQFSPVLPVIAVLMLLMTQITLYRKHIAKTGEEFNLFQAMTQSYSNAYNFLFSFGGLLALAAIAMIFSYKLIVNSIRSNDLCKDQMLEKISSLDKTPECAVTRINVQIPTEYLAMRWKKNFLSTPGTESLPMHSNSDETTDLDTGKKYGV